MMYVPAAERFAHLLRRIRNGKDASHLPVGVFSNTWFMRRPRLLSNADPLVGFLSEYASDWTTGD
jgi:hypothetical protein